MEFTWIQPPRETGGGDFGQDNLWTVDRVEHSIPSFQALLLLNPLSISIRMGIVYFRRCTYFGGDLKLRRAGCSSGSNCLAIREYLSVVRSAIMRLTEELGFPAVESRPDSRRRRSSGQRYSPRVRRPPGQPIELLCRRVSSRVDGKQRAGLEIVMVDRGVCPQIAKSFADDL